MITKNSRISHRSLIKVERIRGYKLNKGGFKLKFWFRITSDATQYFLSTQWLRALYLNREIFPVQHVIEQFIYVFKKVILFKLDGLYFLVIGCVFILLVYFIFLVFIFIHLFKTELQANDKGMLNLTHCRFT